MAEVKGAGDTHMASNPAVHSKFDRSHGRGIPAPHVGHPGGTLSITGTKIPGHNENGRLEPRSVDPGVGPHKVTHHPPQTLGSNLADGERGITGSKNSHYTDHVDHLKPRHFGLSGMLHGEPETVGRDKGGIQKAGKDARREDSHKGTSSRLHSKPGHSMETVTRASQKRDSGALAGEPGPRNSYTGGRGRIR